MEPNHSKLADVLKTAESQVRDIILGKIKKMERFPVMPMATGREKYSISEDFFSAEVMEVSLVSAIPLGPSEEWSMPVLTKEGIFYCHMAWGTQNGSFVDKYPTLLKARSSPEIWLSYAMYAMELLSIRRPREASRAVRPGEEFCRVRGCGTVAKAFEFRKKNSCPKCHSDLWHRSFKYHLPVPA